MPNIRFNYLYRDSANYKKYNSIIFNNDDSVDIEELSSLIKSKLICGEWFYADKWQLPEIFLNTFDFKIDPTWHEFEGIEHTEEAPNSILTIAEFIDIIKK